MSFAHVALFYQSLIATIAKVMLTKVASRTALAALCVAGFGLSACGGGGSGGGGSVPTTAPTSTAPPGTPTPPPATSTPAVTPTPPPPTLPPGPTPTPPGASTQTLHATQGGLNGRIGGFTPSEGNTSSGGTGGNVDGIPCLPVMPTTYHVHIFLGVYNNGTLMALPIGTGMVNPGTPVSGFLNTAQCFYFTHTHDSSGIVHIESNQNVAVTKSIYTLKTYLDIWGITADANHFGPFQGPVRVFTSGQVYRGNMNNGLVTANNYTYYGSDPSSVPLYSHEVIFVEVGPNYPALPNVSFYTNF